MVKPRSQQKKPVNRRPWAYIQHTFLVSRCVFHLPNSDISFGTHLYDWRGYFGKTSMWLGPYVFRKPCFFSWWPIELMLLCLKEIWWSHPSSHPNFHKFGNIPNATCKLLDKPSASTGYLVLSWSRNIPPLKNREKLLKMAMLGNHQKFHPPPASKWVKSLRSKQRRQKNIGFHGIFVALKGYMNHLS